MFGLEKQKKQKSEEFIFDLEKELKNKASATKMRNHVEEKMRILRDALRNGGKQEEVDKFGQLLYGYASLLKVMARANTPKKG